MTNDFKPAKAGGNQPRLSKEEYAEKKRAEKEKVYQMIDDAAREIVSDPEPRAFLIRRVEWTIFRSKCSPYLQSVSAGDTA